MDKYDFVLNKDVEELAPVMRDALIWLKRKGVKESYLASALGVPITMLDKLEKDTVHLRASILLRMLVIIYKMDRNEFKNLIERIFKIYSADFSVKEVLCDEKC